MFRVRRLVQPVAATLPKTLLSWRKLEVGPKLLAWYRPKPQSPSRRCVWREYSSIRPCIAAFADHAKATAVWEPVRTSRSVPIFKFDRTRCFAGQSPLISVSQLFMTERSGSAQQGGGRL